MAMISVQENISRQEQHLGSLMDDLADVDGGIFTHETKVHILKAKKVAIKKEIAKKQSALGGQFLLLNCINRITPPIIQPRTSSPISGNCSISPVRRGNQALVTSAEEAAGDESANRELDFSAADLTGLSEVETDGEEHYDEEHPQNVDVENARHWSDPCQNLYLRKADSTKITTSDRAGGITDKNVEAVEKTREQLLALLEGDESIGCFRLPNSGRMFCVTCNSPSYSKAGFCKIFWVHFAERNVIY